MAFACRELSEKRATVLIDASHSEVWLADLEAVELYSPSVKTASYTSAMTGRCIGCLRSASRRFLFRLALPALRQAAQKGVGQGAIGCDNGDPELSFQFRQQPRCP